MSGYSAQIKLNSSRDVSPERAEWEASLTCVELGANALHAFVFIIVLFYQPSISFQIGKCGDLALLSTGREKGVVRKRQERRRGR